MKPVSELDLPTFDYYGEDSPRGDEYHRVVSQARARQLARHVAAGLLRPRPRGGRAVPAQQEGDVPRPGDGEDLRHPARPAARRDRQQHPPRQRRAPRPPAQPRQPRLHAEGGQHAGVPRCRAFWPQLWDGVKDARRCEFVEAFAKPYPSLTIANLMGADLADAPRLHHWSNWIQAQFDFQAIMNERDKIEQAVIEFYDWAHELLERRRDDPGDGPDLDAAGRRGRGRPPVRRRVREPRPQRPGRRRRHDPEPARPGHPPVRRAPRPVGAAGAAAGARGQRGLGDPALRADHAVHGADHARGHGGRTMSCSRRGRSSSSALSPPTARSSAARTSTSRPSAHSGC